MNKLLFTALIVSMSLFSFQSFAQKEETKTMPEKSPMMQKNAMHGDAAEEHGCGEMAGMCQAHGMIMKDLMTGSMIATSDGGVIIKQGLKIYKYDKDLNLIKGVELKMDMDAMAKMMNEMKEKCPMGKMPMMDKEKSMTKEEKTPVKKEMQKQEKK
jgi:hypothetical protein